MVLNYLYIYTLIAWKYEHIYLIIITYIFGKLITLVQQICWTLRAL